MKARIGNDIEIEGSASEIAEYFAQYHRMVKRPKESEGGW